LQRFVVGFKVSRRLRKAVAEERIAFWVWLYAFKNKNEEKVLSQRRQGEVGL
jgi:hypothetical protein